jgi:hypothetical protein
MDARAAASRSAALAGVAVDLEPRSLSPKGRASGGLRLSQIGAVAVLVDPVARNLCGQRVHAAIEIVAITTAEYGRDAVPVEVDCVPPQAGQVAGRILIVL